MPTDAERFRILAELKLSITWSDDSRVVVFWRGKPKPGQPGGYLPVAEATTLEAAVDEAIIKHEAKKSKRGRPSSA
jgi:hypothetical protein